MEESRYMHSILLDYYGDLLTEKQRECCELHYNEDLSLAEIAEQCGISRQGVWDNIRRADAAMERVEQKVGLVARRNCRIKELEELNLLLSQIAAQTQGELLDLAERAVKIAERMITEG